MNSYTTNLKRSIYFFLMVLLSFSCIAPKKTIYMQDKSGKKKYTNVYSKATVITENYKIQTNDYLYINVISNNEKVSAYYNISGGSTSNNNMMTGQEGYKFLSYLVDDKGDIDIPTLGKIQVKGLTRSEVKQKLTEILQSQIDNFTLMVELTNTHFFILGEANAGMYSMPKDQITIYDAIAISGDLTTYSKRKQVKIIRPTVSGESTIITVDLTDSNLLDSQESYIYPNDMIYVEPIKAKVFGFDETIPYGLITSLLGVYLLVLTVIN